MAARVTRISILIHAANVTQVAQVASARVTHVAAKVTTVKAAVTQAALIIAAVDKRARLVRLIAGRAAVEAAVKATVIVGTGLITATARVCLIRSTAEATLIATVDVGARLITLIPRSALVASVTLVAFITIRTRLLALAAFIVGAALVSTLPGRRHFGTLRRDWPTWTARSRTSALRRPRGLLRSRAA